MNKFGSMEDLILEATKSTPRIEFISTTGVCSISGQSYPENAAAFYGPVVQWINSHFERKPAQTVFEFFIDYINTSSSKMFINIFDILEQWSQDGNNLAVRWVYETGNDVTQDWGQEFKEGLDLNFELVEKEDVG